MKPSHRIVAPRAHERREPQREGADAKEGSRADPIDSIEGEEGNGGAYGRPRRGDADEKSDRSRERG